MLDGVSLDQLRTFIAAVDEGSFSAAARKLNRVQSAVSGWVGSLEAQIGVVLFDRSGRFPKLTPEGSLLLADARNIVSGVDTLKARAKLMASGVEPELAVVVDVFFPPAIVSGAAKAFAKRVSAHPATHFRRRAWSGVSTGPGWPVQPGHSRELAGGIPFAGQRAAGDGHPGCSGCAEPSIGTHSISGYRNRNWRKPFSWCSRTGPSCWPGATTASSRRTAGGWPICRPSTPFSRMEWDGEGCPCTWSNRTLPMAHCVLDVDDLPSAGTEFAISACTRRRTRPGRQGRWLIEYLKTAAAALPSSGSKR
jgi:hypothetical protein